MTPTTTGTCQASGSSVQHPAGRHTPPACPLAVASTSQHAGSAPTRVLSQHVCPSSRAHPSLHPQLQPSTPSSLSLDPATPRASGRGTHESWPSPWPSWPLTPRPQEKTSPQAVTAMVCRQPHARPRNSAGAMVSTLVGEHTSTMVPRPSCPNCPHARRHGRAGVRGGVLPPKSSQARAALLLPSDLGPGQSFVGHTPIPDCQLLLHTCGSTTSRWVKACKPRHHRIAGVACTRTDLPRVSPQHAAASLPPSPAPTGAAYPVPAPAVQLPGVVCSHGVPPAPGDEGDVDLPQRLNDFRQHLVPAPEAPRWELGWTV